jgi:hypothetical protein
MHTAQSAIHPSILHCVTQLADVHMSRMDCYRIVLHQPKKNKNACCDHQKRTDRTVWMINAADAAAIAAAAVNAYMCMTLCDHVQTNNW